MSAARLYIWIHWSRAPKRVTRGLESYQKQEFGAKSQAALYQNKASLWPGVGWKRGVGCSERRL
jgi:hypothetical protein